MMTDVERFVSDKCDGVEAIEIESRMRISLCYMYSEEYKFVS